MSAFSDAELAYLSGERHLARLATVQPDGMPHVVPVGWGYNPMLDTIDISGHSFAATRKYRNVQGNALVAIVIDDVRPPWRPRAVMVQGRAEVLEPGDGATEASIRIRPEKVVSWGLDDGASA